MKLLSVLLIAFGIAIVFFAGFFAGKDEIDAGLCGFIACAGSVLAMVGTFILSDLTRKS